MKRLRTALGALAVGAMAIGLGGPWWASEEAPADRFSRADGDLVAPPQLGPSAPRYDSKNTDGRKGAAPGKGLVYRSGQRLVTDAAATANAPESRLWRTSFGSWEPTVATNSRGAVFMSSRNANNDPGITKSVDGGVTWKPVGPDAHDVSLDPYVWVDPATDRLFASDIDPTIACAPVSYSDDDGGTWKSSRVCGIADHQSLFGGPPSKSAPTKPEGYENVLYYCAIGKGATTVAPTEAGCMRSLDGGASWQATEQPAFPPRFEGTQRCGGFHGHGAVGPDGTAYLPSGWCGKPHLAISKDHGLTWEQVQVSEKDAGGHDGGIAVDPSGTLYYTWVDGDDRAQLTISRDGGKTWSKEIDVTPPPATQVTAHTVGIDVRQDGRLAMVFMGTNAKEPDETTPWNAYVITTLDALDADPLFYSTTINDPDTNALHRGSSCCGNVGDFIDVTIGPEGTVWTALVDTCTSPEDECIYSDAGLVTEPRGEGVVGQVVGGFPLIGTVAEQLPSVSLPPSRGCVGASDIVVRVGKPKRGRLTVATIYVDGRRKAVLRGRKLRRPLRLRGLATGTHKVKVVARTTSGRTKTTTRTYRVCR